MHAKPQFRVYMMHDLGALRRARPTAIAVPLVYRMRCKAPRWPIYIVYKRRHVSFYLYLYCLINEGTEFIAHFIDFKISTFQNPIYIYL